MTILVVSEMDVGSACRLIEWMSHQQTRVDLCLVGGPLAPVTALEPDCLNPTKEQSLAAGKRRESMSPAWPPYMMLKLRGDGGSLQVLGGMEKLRKSLTF